MQTKQWRWGLLLLCLPALAQAECFTRVGHAFGIARHCWRPSPGKSRNLASHR
ncbi:Uncharacterised protein [Cedecea neteri]|uniref:Uncharacterized protein n=1 Tax=Cedecea neteri TaxID=158822 RepID=A0A2X2STN5_9ENTR|nr:Uncharacterised protein [Cedecea neteri]